MFKKSFQLFIGLGICLSFLNYATAAQAMDTVVADNQQGGVTTNLGLYGGDNWDIAVDGDYVYTIASGTPNGFFYSVDAGVTWHQPSGNNDFGSGQSVEVNSTTGTVYVGLGGDLYQSTDHGTTLTLIKENAGNPMVVTSDAIMAGWNNQVNISTDGGTTWATSTVNETGSLWSLAASPTAGTFFATTYDNDTQIGVLNLTVDYGTTWTPLAVTVDSIENTSFTTVHTNPYTAAEFTVGNDHHLWRSTDSGVTFTEITNAPASCNAITAWTSTGRMYACSSVTDDGGATWTQMNFTDIVRGPGKVIVVNSADEQVLYADSMSGVTKSVDGGVTWQNSYSGITGVNAQAISLTTDKTTAWVSSGQGLAKSINFNSGDPTWEFPILPCAPERCDPSGIGASVWVKSDDATIVLAGSIGGFIFRSVDSGTTWTLAATPSINTEQYIDSNTGMNTLQPYQFVSDPNDSAVVYAALANTADGVLLKSIDSGANWTDMGLIDNAPAHSIAISPTGILYVGTGNSDTITKGVYQYANATWTKLSGIPTTVDINSILVDPDNESIIYVAAAGDGLLGDDGFYKSIDAGTTWNKITGLEDYYSFNSITLQRSTQPNTLYVSCRDGDSHGLLLKSSDRGETWGVLYTGLKNETFNTVVFDGLVVGSKHGLFSLKSKAKFKSLTGTMVAKGDTATISAKLLDKTTNKILAHRSVSLYQKHGNRWVLKTHKKTNRNGNITFHFAPLATHYYRLSWTPSQNYSEEYTRSNSKNIVIQVQ